MAITGGCGTGVNLKCDKKRTCQFYININSITHINDFKDPFLNIDVDKFITLFRLVSHYSSLVVFIVAFAFD